MTKEEINLKNKIYYHKNREKIIKKMREKYAINPSRYNRDIKAYHKRYESDIEFRKKRREYSKKWHKKWRCETFEMYGNKCQKCGFSNFKALQLDHINGGGNKERKEYNRGRNAKMLYDFVKKNKDKFQLLCANCNWIKRADENEHPFKNMKEPPVYK